MKKAVILLVALLLTGSLAACGRRDKTPTTAATTAPTRSTSPIPGLDPTIMDPTFETNIPDPNVNSTMPSIIPDVSIPDFTDGTDHTNTYREDMK